MIMKLNRFTAGLMMLTVSATAMAGQDEYDECILKHLKNAKLDFATRLIRQACEENYRTPSFTSDKRQAYNACLLEYLPGIESIHAVMEVKGACYRKHD